MSVKNPEKNSDYWAGYYEESARRVAKNLAMDGANKQTILKEAPFLAQALDSAELAQMSSAELAAYRKAFDAGRRYQHAGGSSTDSGGSSFIDKYTAEGNVVDELRSVLDKHS